MTDRDVAIVVGGSAACMEEFEAARTLVVGNNKTYELFCVNDQIARFPEHIDNAVTLHPIKLSAWFADRLRAALPGIDRVWAHHPAEGVTNSTPEWNGSVGLLAVACARVRGYTHIILAGVPMEVMHGHFIRQRRWNDAHGFRRGWERVLAPKNPKTIVPYVRSMSGWTRERLGAPTAEWLAEDIPDRHPISRKPVSMRA